MKKELKGDMLFMPLPVLMIGTYDENGVPNLMNAAWGTRSDYHEVYISMGMIPFMPWNVSAWQR